MLSAFFSALRLVWPFIRELLFKDNDAKHSIEKNREYLILAGMFLGIFSLGILTIEHALSNHRYYTKKLNEAALNLDRYAVVQQLLTESRDEAKRLRNKNDALEDDLRKANALTNELLGKVPKNKATQLLNREMSKADTPGQRRTIRDRLKELDKKYDEGG